MLASENDNIDWKLILDEHLVQVGFFQHERLIHLLVTLAFALLTMISIISTIFFESVELMILSLLFLCLLVPYIRHYYLLENEVQKMYYQYDEILKKINEKTHKG